MPKQRPINLRRPVAKEEIRGMMIPISGHSLNDHIILRYMFPTSGRITNATVRSEELSEPTAILSIERNYGKGHTVLDLVIKKGINQFDDSFPIDAGDCVEVYISSHGPVESFKSGNVWFSCIFEQGV